MKIVENHWRGPICFDSVEDAVKSAVATTHADGQIEQLRDQVDNLCGMVARLIERASLSRGQLETVLGPDFEVKEY